MAKSIGELQKEILAPLLKREKHFMLMMQWDSIVPLVSAHTWPLKIVENAVTGHVLYIQVSQGAEWEVWSHTQYILRGVNQYMGWNAIKRLHISKKV